MITKRVRIYDERINIGSERVIWRSERQDKVIEVSVERNISEDNFYFGNVTFSVFLALIEKTISTL